MGQYRQSSVDMLGCRKTSGLTGWSRRRKMYLWGDEKGVSVLKY